MNVDHFNHSEAVRDVPADAVPGRALAGRLSRWMALLPLQLT